MYDIIKEYMVGLGFRVDASSLNRAKGAMNDAEKTVEKFAGKSIARFAAAGAAVTTFVAVANIGIAKYVAGLAKADLENQKLARLMWTSKDNVMAYKYSLDALGATVQDLVLSPELMQRYLQLRQQSFAMRAPEEYGQYMKDIRSIVFEFQRMKLEATYAMQWIGYYIAKYLNLAGFKGNLEDINGLIIKKMPEWTKQVAQVATWFIRMGEAAYQLGDDIIKIWNGLSSETKAVTGIVAGFFALLKMGPIGWMIAGLTTLLILLDDYYAYQRKDGSKTQFDKMWVWLDDLKAKLESDGTLDKLKDSVQNLADNIINLGTSFGNLFATLAGEKGEGVISFFRTLSELVETIATGLGQIAGLINILAGKDELGKKQIQDSVRDENGNLPTKIQGEDTEEMLRIGKSFWDWWNNLKNSPGPGDYIMGLLTGNKNYLYPAPAASNTTVTVSPTISIYTNDPNKAGAAVEKALDEYGIYIRSFLGINR